MKLVAVGQVDIDQSADRTDSSGASSWLDYRSYFHCDFLSVLSKSHRGYLELAGLQSLGLEKHMGNPWLAMVHWDAGMDIERSLRSEVHFWRRGDLVDQNLQTSMKYKCFYYYCCRCY